MQLRGWRSTIDQAGLPVHCAAPARSILRPVKGGRGHGAQQNDEAASLRQPPPHHHGMDHLYAAKHVTMRLTTKYAGCCQIHARVQPTVSQDALCLVQTTASPPQIVHAPRNTQHMAARQLHLPIPVQVFEVGCSMLECIIRQNVCTTSLVVAEAL